jgi:hypothetical protein
MGSLQLLASLSFAIRLCLAGSCCCKNTTFQFEDRKQHWLVCYVASHRCVLKNPTDSPK